MADYGVGNAGILRVTDDGSTVRFYVINNSGSTYTGAYDWFGTVNGVGVGGRISISGAGTYLLGAWGVSYTQNVRIGQQDTGTWGLGGFAQFDTYIFRPTVPSAPSPIGIDQITATSMRYRFSGNSDGGSGILEWQAQTATNSGFSANVQTVSSSGTTTFTGLLPGNTYYARSRGRNGVGWGPWSSVISAYVGLPAPTLKTWTQNSTGGLVATWTAPSTTTGLIGYRLQVARDANFTVSPQFIDVGDVLTATFTGLAGGRVWYARVAARTAGGVNAYSSSLYTMLVLEAGDLDGWTRVGTKPPQISYYTTEGLRRGITGTTQALWLESLSTGGITLATDTYGIQRTFTELVVGKTYRFEARGTLAGTPKASSYRLSVVSESDGAPVTVVSDTALPYVDFVADSTTVVCRIMLAQAVTMTGATDEVERVAFHTITLTEAVTDYPQRLRETVYESNLANHLDMACNSVGATWYVGPDGVTRFRLPGSALPVSATFTDKTDDNALHYIDIAAARDTRGMFNRLDVTNYGVDAERTNEENDELAPQASASVTKYGVRSVRLETNLWSQPPYDESLNNRLNALLAENSEPQFLMTQLGWNAQENLPMAGVLDIGQRVTVSRKGITQNSQIVALTHDITPERWLITIDLRRVGA